MERRNATRPYFRQSAERDHLYLLAITFATGAMLGATLALAWALS